MQIIAQIIILMLYKRIFNDEKQKNYIHINSGKIFLWIF